LAITESRSGYAAVNHLEPTILIESSDVGARRLHVASTLSEYLDYSHDSTKNSENKYAVPALQIIAAVDSCIVCVEVSSHKIVYVDTYQEQN